MSTVYFVLAGMNLMLIGLLPRIFFDKAGSKNLLWWATAAPFYAAGVATVLVYAEVWQPWCPPEALATGEAVAVPFAAASIALIAFTIGSHRVPLALWHQDDDAPRSIVTHGAYKYVRHPFYSAFLLALTGIVVAVPHPATVACLVYAAAMLHFTARREERRLSASAFGEEYRSYLARTGRFFPRFRSGTSA